MAQETGKKKQNF